MMNIDFEERKLKIKSNLQNHDLQLHRYKKNKFGISELVFCPKKSFFIRNGSPIPKPNGKMITGTLFHELNPIAIKDLPGVTNPQFEQECKTEVTDEYGTYTITGHSDVLCDEKVLEFKFSKIWKRKPISQYYFYQANAYAFLQDRPEFEIIVIDKDTLQIEILTGKTNEKQFEEVILGNARRAWEALNTGIMPNVGPMYEWECKYCDFFEECKDKKTHDAMEEAGLL